MIGGAAAFSPAKEVSLHVAVRHGADDSAMIAARYDFGIGAASSLV
jgi:hypothetical protein